jgi:hypothetical protein
VEDCQGQCTVVELQSNEDSEYENTPHLVYMGY